MEKKKCVAGKHENPLSCSRKEVSEHTDYCSQSEWGDLHGHSLITEKNLHCDYANQTLHNQSAGICIAKKKTVQLCFSALIASLHFNCVSHSSRMTPTLLSTEQKATWQNHPEHFTNVSKSPNNPITKLESQKHYSLKISDHDMTNTIKGIQLFSCVNFLGMNDILVFKKSSEIIHNNYIEH